MSRAFDGLCAAVPLAFGQGTVVVGAAVLDREEFAIAVEDGDRLAFMLDDLPLAGGEFGDRADRIFVFSSIVIVVTVATSKPT